MNSLFDNFFSCKLENSYTFENNKQSNFFLLASLNSCILIEDFNDKHTGNIFGNK